MCNPKNHTWDQFILRININVDLSRVYNAIASPGGLESWFLRSAVFNDKQGQRRSPEALIQAADQYSMLWFGYPDSVRQNGSVLLANGIDQFHFSFSENCPVEISLSKESNETILELTEKLDSLDEETRKKYYYADSQGWTFYLTNLKSVLEGGLDLRNKNREIKNVISA